MADSFRFSDDDVATWRREGVAQIQSFFTPEEVAPVVADFEKVFGKSAGSEEGLDHKSGGEVGRFHPAQFKTLEAVPLDCSPALNLIGVHPALVAFARAALGTEAASAASRSFGVGAAASGFLHAQRLAAASPISNTRNSIFKRPSAGNRAHAARP